MFQRISEEGSRCRVEDGSQEGEGWQDTWSIIVNNCQYLSIIVTWAQCGNTKITLPRLHSFSSAHHLEVNASIHHAMVHNGGVVGDVLPGQHGLGLRLQRTVATHGATAVRRHLDTQPPWLVFLPNNHPRWNNTECLERSASLISIVYGISQTNMWVMNFDLRGVLRGPCGPKEGPGSQKA